MQSAKLIAITSPQIAKDGNDLRDYGKPSKMSAGEFIAYCARVSNPGNQKNSLSAPKLVKYLYDMGHWSPFEMVSVVIEINTTRDIGRQVLRHRSCSFQEFSQRYADPRQFMTDPIYREARLQDTKNRQNSISTDDDVLQKEWNWWQDRVRKEAMLAYEWAESKGIAKEQCRVVLPEGLTPTRMYVGGTVRSWIHYVKERERVGVAQKEHVELAGMARRELITAMPELEEAF